MKKLSYLIVLVLILGLALAGCTFLSNIGQAPATEQSGIAYLTKALPLADLVGLWRFDEGSGTTAYDNSGTIPPNDGTVNGATYVDSPMGQALIFDGVSNYVDCGNDTSLDITQAITIEAWVKPSAFPTTPGHSTIATKARAYYFQVDGSGYLQVYQYGTSPAGYHSSTNPISLNVWQHVAYTYDGSNVRMFINGVLDKTIPVEGIIIVSNQHLGIGMNLDAFGNPYSGYFRQFQGEIDEVRIWNRALDASELIRYGFNGLLAPYESPPKAFKAGRSIPLKWQYTDNFGDEVESSAAEPSVKVLFKGTIEALTDEPIEVLDPGTSGYRYHSGTKTWQFNWQTKGCGAGRYEIRITSMQTDQINGPFLIDLQ